MSYFLTIEENGLLIKRKSSAKSKQLKIGYEFKIVIFLVMFRNRYKRVFIKILVLLLRHSMRFWGSKWSKIYHFLLW